MFGERVAFPAQSSDRLACTLTDPDSWPEVLLDGPDLLSSTIYFHRHPYMIKDYGRPGTLICILAHWESLDITHERMQDFLKGGGGGPT